MLVVNSSSCLLLFACRLMLYSSGTMLLLLLFGLADVPLARQTTPWNPTPHPLGKLNTENTSVALAKQEIWLQIQLLLLLYRVGFLCFLDCFGLFSYFMSTKSSTPLIWVDFWRKLDLLNKEENGLDSSKEVMSWLLKGCGKSVFDGTMKL